MTDLDNKDLSCEIETDEMLISSEVIQDDVDLYYLHHYLMDVFRKE